MERQLNELGQAVVAAGTDARYDAEAKKLLANKPFLAWILKYSTTEFKNMTPDEIVPYIDNDPRISSVSVLPGETNRPITGISQKGTVYRQESIKKV